MSQNKSAWFYTGGSGLDRTDDFQKFCGSGLDGFNFTESGLDSDWKFLQSAHLCFVPMLERRNVSELKANCLSNVFMRTNFTGHNDFTSFPISYQFCDNGAFAKCVWNENSPRAKRVHFPNRGCLHYGLDGTVGTHFFWNLSECCLSVLSAYTLEFAFYALSTTAAIFPISCHCQPAHSFAHITLDRFHTLPASRGGTGYRSRFWQDSVFFVRTRIRAQSPVM